MQRFRMFRVMQLIAYIVIALSTIAVILERTQFQRVMGYLGLGVFSLGGVIMLLNYRFFSKVVFTQKFTNTGIMIALAAAVFLSSILTFGSITITAVILATGILVISLFYSLVSLETEKRA